MSDIKIKIIEESKKLSVGFTNLKFEMSGKDIDCVVSNTILRVIGSLVGSYAFNPDLFKYTDKEKRVMPIYNRSEIDLRLENIPISYKLQQPKNYFDRCIELENKIYNPDIFTSKSDLDILKEQEKIDIENIKNLNMHVNVVNDTDDIINVTTSNKNVTFYYDSKEINNVFNDGYECLLIDLKPKQEFECTCYTDFNIPMYHDRYKTCCAVGHEIIDDKKIIIYLESYGQISERDIIKRACELIKRRLLLLKNVVIGNIKSDNKNKGELMIENENDTFGYLLFSRLLNNKDIEACTYSREHLEQYKIKLEYITKSKDFDKILNEVVNDIIKIYESISKNL